MENREIKFRAWDTEKNVMVYNNENNDADFWDGIYMSRLGLINSTLNDKDLFLVFQQYTGLKDRNGKEIYEGDVINIYWGTELKYTGVVKWLIGNAKFMVESGNEYIPMINSHVVFEIIGHKHENPELLK